RRICTTVMVLHIDRGTGIGHTRRGSHRSSAVMQRAVDARASPCPERSDAPPGEIVLTARTLAWTGFLAIAAFALMVASRLTALDPVENLSLSVTAPVQNALHDATQPVADWVNNFTDASGLSTEHKQLRADNERPTNEL